jgi:hypothetical protein
VRFDYGTVFLRRCKLQKPNVARVSSRNRNSVGRTHGKCSAASPLLCRLLCRRTRYTDPVRRLHGMHGMNEIMVRIAVTTQNVIQGATCSDLHGLVGIMLGLAAGLSYHFFCQFPRQVEVLRCLLAIAFINILFSGFLKFIEPMRTNSSFFAGVMVFNMTFVRPF